MKKLFAIALTILMFSGCTGLAPKFDNAEYDRFVVMLGHVQLTVPHCKDAGLIKQQTQALVYNATLMDIYATYRPAHSEIKEITSLILANLTEMKSAYESQSTPSVAYCVGKLKIIENSLKKVLPVMGDLQQ